MMKECELCQAHSDTQPASTLRNIGNLSAHTQNDHDENEPPSNANAVEIQLTAQPETRTPHNTPMAHGKKGVDQRKLDKVVRWLDALSCAEKHENTYHLRQEDTCTWLPKTEGYTKWREGASHFLWLHAKSDAGKSVLAASTIQDLEKEVVFVFFYCNFRNKRSTSATDMMRSLLSRPPNNFQDHDVDPGNLLKNILEEKSKGHSSRRTSRAFVCRVSSCFTRPSIMAIDALDERADQHSTIGNESAPSDYQGQPYRTSFGVFRGSGEGTCSGH